MASDFYLEFQTSGQSVVFTIPNTAELPGELKLYTSTSNCISTPLKVEAISVDSTTVNSLSLSYHNLIIDSKYVLHIIRDPLSEGQAFNFNFGSVSYTVPMYPDCFPGPCPVACNKLYNGSFETALKMPDPVFWHQNIHFSKGWIRPNITQHAADYYHSGSLDPDSEVPENFYGYYEAVPGLDGTDAYAGLFALYGPGSQREWMSGTMKETLLQGHRYKVVW